MGRCSKCNGQGFIESWVMRDNGSRPQIQQCPECRDVSKYSNRIQELLNSELTQQPVEKKQPTLRLVK